MSGVVAIEDIDFDVDEDASEEQEAVSKIAGYDSRRRLEDRLEERRLQKMIRDYDFDID